MRKIISLIFLALFLCACAEKPDGIIVMNEETIENFFEKDKQSWNPPSHLNLLLDQPVAEAALPPLAKGLKQVCGVLASDGAYTINTAEIKNRGSSFSKSVFGMLGPAGTAGNAWFYADYNPETGAVLNGRAYLYGFMGGVCDMRNVSSGFYGSATNGKFYLNINGPCLFPQVSGSTMDYALFIESNQDVLNSSAPFSLRYIVDDTGQIMEIPQNPRSSKAIYDTGSGKGWLYK